MKLSKSKEREVFLTCATDPDAREDWRKRSIRCEIAALFGGGAITHADLKALSEAVLDFDLEEQLARQFKKNPTRFFASYWDGASVAKSLDFYAIETGKPGDFFRLMLTLLRFIVAGLPAETAAKFWTLVSDYPADELPAEILEDKDYKAALGNKDAGRYTDSDRARDERAVGIAGRIEGKRDAIGERLEDISADAAAAALNSAQTKRNFDEEIDRRVRIKARQRQGGRDGVSRRGDCDNAARDENILREVKRRVDRSEKLENIFREIASKYGLTAAGVKSIYYRKRRGG